MTLFDAMEAMYKKYGYFIERGISIVEEGIEGPQRIASMIDNIRNNCPKTLGGLSVDAVRDYTTGVIRYSDGTEKSTNQPKNNMLYLELADRRGWIAIRPSGTEPKLKLYFGYSNRDKNIAEETITELMRDTQEKIKG